ncbi:Galectin-4, partial [Ophiophagus hannah]
MLFQRGVSFEVSVNGSQFIDYRHRLSMNLVQTLQIKGDVSLNCINFTGGFNFGGMTVCSPVRDLLSCF